MATAEVDTAETVPLKPLQKIEVDDKELLTAEYDGSANELSKDELKKIEIEITKALETVEQLGEEETETPQVQSDAWVRSFGAGAHKNVGVSEGRVFEKIPLDPEVAEERTSTESHVHADNEEKDVNGKLEELEESSIVEKDVDKVEEQEKDVPFAENVDKEEAEEPIVSQLAEHVPGVTGRTPSENADFSDHHLGLELHKEGETQPGQKENSYDSVKEVSSVPIEQIEEDAVVNDSNEEHAKRLDSEAKETGTPENQKEVHNDPESVPNAENMDAAKSSDEVQGTKEENILEDPSTSNTDNDDLETKKYVEVIVNDFQTKELTTDTDTQRDEGVEKEVPERLAQSEERLHFQAMELETKEKETYSIQVEKHIGKVEKELEKGISLKDDHGVEKLESSSGIIHEKIEEAEPSENADKIIMDVTEGNIINEQQMEEKDTDYKEHTPTKETARTFCHSVIIETVKLIQDTDVAQLELELTENEDVKNPIEDGLSSLIEQSAESKKIDDADAGRAKTDEEKEIVSQTEIAEEKTLGTPDIEVETVNFQSAGLEKPQETDLEQDYIVKDAATEKIDVVQVTEEPQEVEGAEVHTTADSNELDIPPVSSVTSEVNEQSCEETSKEKPSPTSHIEQLLQEEENKYEKRGAIIEEVNDEPISTSIDGSITEQTDIVGQDGNLFTESHEEDVTAVSQDDENQDSNKKEISEHFITEVSKIDEESEKSTLQNDKPDAELPEISSNSSAEKPEVVVSDDSIRITTTEELAYKIKEKDIYTIEYKASDTESAREMNFALTETNENTGDEKTGTMEKNADMKEIQSIDQTPTEEKDKVSDDAGISILPEEEKNYISAASKTVDSTPAENIEEKEEKSDLREETTLKLEKLHNIDSLQISKDEDAEAKEGGKIKIYEKNVTDVSSLTVTADESSSELPLPVDSNQKGTSKDEEDDEKPVQICVPVPVVTPAEFEEDARGKDEDMCASLSAQESVEKVEHISQTEKKEPTGKCDIQGIAEELPVISQGDASVNISYVAEKGFTENAEDKSSDKTVEESVVEDATKPDELIVPVTGIQTRGTEEVSTQAKQIEEAASLDHIENKVQKSLEVVSEPDPDDTENQEKVTELDPDDSDNSEKVSKSDQDNTENLKQVSVAAATGKLKQGSEPNPDDSEKLKQVFEPDLDNSEYLKQTTEPDPDDSEIPDQISEPDPDDSEALEQLSKPDPDHSEVSEPDPDDAETLRSSEPDPDDSENHEKVEKTDIDFDEVTIKSQPVSTTVEVLEKTDGKPRETTLSDEVVIKDENENDQPQNDDNVEDKRTADEVVVQEDAQAHPSKKLNKPKGNEQSPSSLNNEDAIILEREIGPEGVQESVEKTEIREDCDEATIKEHPMKTSVEVLEKTDEQPRDTTVSDEASSVNVVEEAVTRSTAAVRETVPEVSLENSVHEECVSYQIPERRSEVISEPSQTTKEQITESDIEPVEESVTIIQPNDAKEENKTSEALEKNIIEEVGAEGSPPADAFVEDNKPDEADKDINKKDEIKKVAADKKDESEIPVALIGGDQNLDQEIKEKQEEFLKDEDGKETILQENEPEEKPEHLLEPSASSSNDDRITDLVSKDVIKDVLGDEKEKDGLEDAGNAAENISVSEVLEQPHYNTGGDSERLPSKPEETELATSSANYENIAILKSQEDKEIQDELESEIFIGDRKEKDQQKTDDYVEEKQTVDEVAVPEDEPQGNKPSITGLNDEDTIECKKGPKEVQEELSVESNPEDDDNFTERKVTEEAVVLQDDQREERVNLPNEAEHIEIPSNNFAALKDEEKENEKEAEKEQDQANENNTVRELETVTEVIIHEDQQGEQLKHLQSEDEEAELLTTGVNDAEIAIPKNSAKEAVQDENVKEIETNSEKVVQKSKAVTQEYLPSDSVEAEPSGVYERTIVLKTEEETEETLQDEKKNVQVNIDSEERENVDEALKQEAEQGQLGHVSDGTKNLETSVSYTSGEKQTSLESKEILKEDREEKSKNDHTEVGVEENEIVSREFVLQEPSASLGNDDDITTQRGEEPPEEVQEQKETKPAVADGDTKMSESESTALIHGFTREEDDLVNKIVEAESSVRNAQSEESVTRCEESTERVEEEGQEKDQVIDQKVTSNAISVKVDKKGNGIEQFSNLIEETEQYASYAGDDKIAIIDSGEKTDTGDSNKCSQEIEDETKEKDPSNEDSKSSLQELDVASIVNNLESKEPENIEDNVKEHSTFADGSSSSNLENKVEMSNFETEHNKSVDEEVATADEIKIIYELHESFVEKDIHEVVTASKALPIAEDKFNYVDGKGLTETETSDGEALESFPSVEVSDSEVQGDFVETAKETEEEKVEIIILVAGEEDKNDLIITETDAAKLQGSKENEVPILGDENQYANKFVTTNTEEKNLLESSEVPTPAADDDKVDVTLKETLNEVHRKCPGYQEAESLGDENQKKLSIRETLHGNTTEKTIEQKCYVEVDTTAGTIAVEPEEISASVLANGDEIQIEHERDGNLPAIKDKSSLGLDVTRTALETPVTEKVPDESATEHEGTIEQITKDDNIAKESSVNEGKNLQPLSLGSPKPEELNVAEAAEKEEVLQIQEASHVKSQLKDELKKLEGQYIEITHEVEPEEQNNTKQNDDPPSEIVTELVKLQEPESIIPLVGDKRTEVVISTKLYMEETKGETETQIETPSDISEEVGANDVQFQEKLTVSPADDKWEMDQFIKSQVSYEIPEEKKVSAESPQVSMREVYAVEGKQINEALAEELLANKNEAIKETEAVKFEREIKDEGIQDQNTREIKGYKLEGLHLDEPNKYDAAIKVNLTATNATEVTETPSEQLSGIPPEKLHTNIPERRESEEANEESEPVERESTEGVTVGTTCKDPIAIAEKSDTRPSSETDIQSTSRELVNAQSIVSIVQTEGSDTNLGIQQLIQSNEEAPLGENTHADKNQKDGPTPVSIEKKDVPTEIQQSTARSLDFAEVVKPESVKNTESHIPLTIPAESLLSDLLQISPKDTIQMTQKSNKETNTTPKKEDLQTEDPKPNEDKDDEEEGEEHKKTDSSSDGVIVEASRDIDIKSPQKKHQGILSGVGTKVKNSISKVKKAITGKSSHPKPPSPK